MSLINDLDSTKGKKKYQKLSVNLGIESFTVLIPAVQYQTFESKLVESINSPVKFNTRTLTSLVAEFNGTVEG